MASTKLAKAASLQLKGIVVEYDALCSTLIGRTAAEQADQRRRADALHAQQERANEAQGVGLFSKMVKGMFVSDVRSMLKDLNQDATGKPWIVKDRLQSTLQGLPSDVLDRVTGDKSAEHPEAGASEDELYLQKQLASASAEIERMKQQRASEKEELLRRRHGSDVAGDASGARAKYMDKINQLKAKAKARDPNQALAAFSGVSPADAAAATPAKGLTTWLVHDGANELMSYSSMRGLAKAITPPQSDVQAEEFQLFCKEMRDQFDYFMPAEEYAKLPDPAPLLTTIKELELRPLEVLVIARHASTIRAAKAAGAYTCHFRKAESDIPNHSADYQLVGLTEFQYIIEEFNGISYRGRIPQWAPSQF